MNPGEFLDIYQKSTAFGQLEEWMSADKSRVLHLKGLSGSSPALIAAGAIRKSALSHVFILPDKETAAYFQNDLEHFTDDGKTLFFPSSYKRSVQYYQKSKDQIIRRTEILDSFQEESGPHILISYPEALMEKIVARDFLSENAFRIHIGEKLSMSFLADFLDSCRFQQVDFVYEPGQYSLRGSILDVFSYAARHPFRLDFFGEQIDSIRSFDIESQRSIEKKEKVSLIPDLAGLQAEQGNPSMEPFPRFLGRDVIYWAQDLSFIRYRMDDVFERTRGAGEEETDFITDENKAEYLIDGEFLKAVLEPSGSSNSGNRFCFLRMAAFPSILPLSLRSAKTSSCWRKI